MDDYYPISEIEAPESLKNFGRGYTLFVNYCDKHGIEILDEESVKDVLDFLYMGDTKLELNIDVKEGIYSSIELIEAWFDM